MVLVDTHYHASMKWWEPVEVFLFHMDRVGVDRGVLIAFMGGNDNDYLRECQSRFPERIATIGLVDVSASDVEDQMSTLMSQGMSGFRMALPRPETLAAPLTAWRVAEALGAVVSVVGTTTNFASDRFAAAIATVPNLPIIIEHMGVVNRLVTAGHGGDNQPPEPPYDEYRRVLALSRYPNVYIKVTGFSEYMARPEQFSGPAFRLDEAPPFIDMCVDAFGAERMMVGTDPSSSCREGYANVWSDIQSYLRRFSTDQQEAILGGTADRLFHFGTAR